MLVAFALSCATQNADDGIFAAHMSDVVQNVPEDPSRPGDTAESQWSISHVLGFAGAPALPNREPQKKQQLLKTLGFAGDDEYFDAVIAHMKALSGQMARVEFFYVGQGRFVGAESLYNKMQTEGFELCGNLNPIALFEAIDADFDGALKQLVKKYPKIEFWQVGNEPDLLWKNPSLFPKFFLRCQPIIRAAGRKIVLAGISNQYNSSEQNYKLFNKFLGEIIKGCPDKNPFDVFDFHFYKERSRGTDITKTVKTYRDLLALHGFAEGVRLWCTETGIHTGDPPTPQFGFNSETDQAREIAYLVTHLTAQSVERIFFWTVIEGFAGEGIPGYFDQMGLVYNGLGEEVTQGIPANTKKKAYHTYGRLASVLQKLTAATCVAPGVYRFERKGLNSVFVVWNENGQSQVVLSDLSTSFVQVEGLVPDDRGKIEQSKLAVSGGKMTLTVSELPQLVIPIEK